MVKKLLDSMDRSDIHGMVHCSGGAQSKVGHFLVDGLHVIKDNMLPVPPLFRLINECSGTEWSEMYKVFNCGHRMEVYVSPENAEKVIEVSKSFNIDAQVVGRVEAIEGKSKVTVKASTASSRTDEQTGRVSRGVLIYAASEGCVHVM